ncbi:hypothetical protein DFH07DRAFT_841114 [Mycena maculata]|uniref:DUF6593 domain-containing protein n=1 Tax=Mycena maculata TaxID=230809 RepID=A0AAD7IBW3_9AGAR|nr:hypothetical protein DFH07DRAFT_841114 [Mycena maculata]
MATYNLFFTGRDDPRNCVVIGEDIVHRFFCFETPTRPVHGHDVKTTVYSDTNTKVASLLFGSGNQPGSATIGNRAMTMLQLVSAGSVHNARSFFSGDGRKYEWRKSTNVSGAYDVRPLLLVSFHNLFRVLAVCTESPNCTNRGIQ